MAKTKCINIGAWPYAIRGEVCVPGDTFEEEGLALKELLGREVAVEATKENLAKYADVKAAYLESIKPKPEVKKAGK